MLINKEELVLKERKVREALSGAATATTVEDSTAFMAEEEGSYRMEMCPEKERRLRIEHELVHPLERDPDSGAPNRLVKKFSRSAAGHKMDDREQLRSANHCLSTAVYLVTRILGVADLDKMRYDFTCDRLKAIRQDLVIQGAKDECARNVLEISVRFHLYAGYRLCELGPDDFDPVLNFRQALECLKSLLNLYESLGTPAEGRIEMSAAYLILNLGSACAIKWALSLDRSIRRTSLMKRALEANFSYLQRNYVRLFRLTKLLPATSQLAFHWNCPAIMQEALQTMNVAYSSSVLTYPCDNLTRMFGTDANVTQMCANLGISVRGDAIAFKKSQQILLPTAKLKRPRGEKGDQELLSGGTMSRFLLRS